MAEKIQLTDLFNDLERELNIKERIVKTMDRKNKGFNEGLTTEASNIFGYSTNTTSSGLPVAILNIPSKSDT